MYRIEVKPGEETVFRTIEELATGIRNGFITPRARIYHAASQKWLPIEFHPHYKKALDGTFTPTTPAPQPSLAAMPAPTFAFPGATPAAPPPAAPPALVPEAAPVPEPAASAEPPPAPEPPPMVTNVAESPLLAMRAAVVRPVRSEPEADVGPVERYSPVAVLEAPRPAPAPAAAPEIVLPNITYPELPPAEPTEQRATARRTRRASGRPLLLVGSAAVLVFAGQRFLATRGPAPIAPAVTEASEPAPAASPPRAAPAAPSRAAPPVQTPARPMTPGPAFAASVPSRVAPGTSPAPAPAPVASAPPAGSSPALPRPDSAGIAPAPTAIELDVPALLPGESIAPSLDEGRDSLAIKRILKAVTGRKANPSTP